MMTDPIVVCGAPRTGVRLLAAILDDHPALASAPELPMLIALGHQWRDIDRTLGTNHERHYGLTRAATRSNFRTSLLQLIEPRRVQSGKISFVLQSFGMAISLDVFSELLGESRFIVMVRDPRDVARSLLACAWLNPRDGKPLPYTQDLGSAGRFWLEFMQAALRGAARLESTGRLLLLRYEDLCTSPHEVMKRVADFLRVDFHEPRVTANSADLVTLSADQPHPPLRHGPIDISGVGLWRSSLRPADVAVLEHITGPLSKRLGYG